MSKAMADKKSLRSLRCAKPNRRGLALAVPRHHRFAVIIPLPFSLIRVIDGMTAVGAGQKMENTMTTFANEEQEP